MNIDIENEIQSKIPELQQKKHLLHMSCGADSLAAWLRMREWKMDVTPVYMYYLENLPMVELYLDYLEKYFETKIYRLPHPLYWYDMQNGIYQSPMVGQKIYNYINSLCWGEYTNESYNETLKTLLPEMIHANGLRVTDGINRAMSIKKFGAVRNDKWMPIASFGFNDIKELLAKHDLKLPPEYAFMGMSFESPRYWNAGLIKEHCPKTWSKILESFPMMRLLPAQFEASSQDIPGGAKRRITMYKDHVINTRGWDL